MPRISKVVSATRDLRTLSEALIVSGIDVAVDDTGPFTLFAPNEDAFTEIGHDALVALAANPEDLADTLLWHVVPGQYMLAELAELEVLPNALGCDLYVTVGEDDELYVEEARLIEGDIVAANGIIHIVDLVILPLESALAVLTEVAGPTEPHAAPRASARGSDSFFDHEVELEEFADEPWAV